MPVNIKDMKVGVIGAGKLGTVLSRHFAAKGRLHVIADISEDVRSSLKSNFGNQIPIISLLNDEKYLSDIIFLTVSDSQILTSASQLAADMGNSLKGKIIIYCSGILNLEVLEPCRKMGAICFGAHPYQTFFHSDANLLQGVGWGIEQSDNKELILELIKEMGGNPVVLSENAVKNKAAYHCSAVVCSNFMAASVAFAEEIANSVDVDPKDFIPKIIETTINNNISSIKNGGEMPLTGPLARNDTHTIELHIQSLKAYPELLKPYCYLTLASVEIAYQHNILTYENYNYLKKTLFLYL
jgi:predicted short-subunit dehydrogenase-like oxidoreductase (DUF2520 family)